MNRMIKFAVISLLVAGAMQAVNAQVVETKAVPGVSVYNTEDTPKVFRIKYNGSSTTATISNSVDTLWIKDADASGITTVIMTGNAGATLTSMLAATNSTGSKNFQVELVNALAADTISNVVLAAANVSLADGQWHEVVKWDTSQSKTYNTCSYGDGASARWLTTLYGNPGGTGDLTLNVYLDGTEVYSKVITSPYYVPAQITSTTNTNTAINVVNVWENLGSATTYGIYVAPKSKCLIRATRATTATTGSIGGLLTTK